MLKWLSDLNRTLALCRPQHHTRHCCCRTVHPSHHMWHFSPTCQIQDSSKSSSSYSLILLSVSTFVSSRSYHYSKNSSSGTFRAFFVHFRTLEWFVCLLYQNHKLTFAPLFLRSLQHYEASKLYYHCR